VGVNHRCTGIGSNSSISAIKSLSEELNEMEEKNVKIVGVIWGKEIDDQVSRIINNSSVEEISNW
jgi:hypothetical protein